MESELDHIQPHYAFPHPSGAQGTDGLTKREWFAGQAMAALISTLQGSGSREEAGRFAGDAAVLFADALISALETK